MVSREGQNKSVTLAFYDMMFNLCDPRKAIEEFVGDGKEAFIEYFERMTVEFPGKKVYFKRVIATDTLVLATPDSPILYVDVSSIPKNTGGDPVQRKISQIPELHHRGAYSGGVWHSHCLADQ